MSEKILILTGGSIKGAFQAGALRTLFNQGFKPTKVLGISVGALNSTFLVNRIGELNNNFTWEQLGDDIVNFWIDTVKEPSDLVLKKSKLRLAWEILRKDFNGFLDTRPLQEKIRKIAKPENLKRANIKLEIGAVNILTGDIEYFSPEHPNFIDAVIASTAIPFVMPYNNIGGKPYVDGGVRDVAPVGPLIEQKNVSEIVVVSCHASKLRTLDNDFNPGDIMKFSDRIKNILVNETVNNDIALLEKSKIKRTKLNLKPLKFKVIQPKEEINIDITKFTPGDILKMIEMGEKAANGDWIS